MKKLALLLGVLAALLVLRPAHMPAQSDNKILVYGNSAGTIRPMAVGVNGEQLERSVNHFTGSSIPAANAQATVTQASGGAGIVNVADCVSFSALTGTVAPAAANVVVNLRDGATGAGTVLASWNVGFPATASTNFVWGVCGLNVSGSAATAMTLEFSAAGGANTLESVHISGFTR